MPKTLYSEWDIFSFSMASDSNKKVVYITFIKTTVLNNNLNKFTPNKYIPFIYNKEQIVVLNGTRIE